MSQYFFLYFVHTYGEIFPSRIAYSALISVIYYVTFISIVTDYENSYIFNLNEYKSKFNSPTTFDVESKALISLIIYWQYRKRTYRYGNKF